MFEEKPVIEGGYFRDILAQPEALRRSIKGFEESAELCALGARLRAGKYRRVILTGMGSSLHAFHPLYVDLSRHGITAAMLETSELIHYHETLLDSESLAIVVSQSGRSAEIVRLLEVNAGRAAVVGVTNDPGSPLATRCMVSVLTQAGTEASVSSKTYVCSLAALAWLGAHFFGRDLGRARAELLELPDAVSSYVGTWQDHVRQAQEEMSGITDLFIVGRGPSMATAATAGLITKESTHLHAEGMSAAAFRHGPLEMVSGRVFLMAMECDPRTAELNARLVKDVKAAGGRATLVRESAKAALFHTPPVPPGLRQVVEILPVQMVTLALAALVGREAGAFRLATKVTTEE